MKFLNECTENINKLVYKNIRYNYIIKYSLGIIKIKEKLYIKSKAYVLPATIGRLVD